jgi:hypothetical protein
MSFLILQKIKRNASSHSLVFIGIVLSICSCRSDFETVASTGDLTFQKTPSILTPFLLILALVHTDLKYTTKVKNDITIPSIKLAKD